MQSVRHNTEYQHRPESCYRQPDLNPWWHRRLTMRLNGRAMAPDRRRERKLPPALTMRPPTPHGPLQRLQGVAL